MKKIPFDHLKKHYYELYISDDCSNDDTINYIKQLKLKYKAKLNTNINNVNLQDGMGLQSIKTRITHLNGTFEVDSTINKGSSLKFCVIAEGSADIYPRYSPTMEWDTAAGHAIINASRSEVINLKTRRPLCYNKKNLLNPPFLVKRK